MPGANGEKTEWNRHSNSNKNKTCTQDKPQLNVLSLAYKKMSKLTITVTIFETTL